MNYIIHFTNNFSKIESILSSKAVHLTYSSEIFQLGNQRISSAAHPIVCFSEYSLEELENKTITYGAYGLVLSKDWAEKKELHPVLYVDKNPIVAKSLAVLLRARRNKEKALPPDLRLQIMTLKCFTKNIIGYNSYFDKHGFNFREEKEWRFVPQKNQIGNGLISQNLNKFLSKKNFYNDKLLDYPLRFDLSDIKYIFVSNQNEIGYIADKFSIDRDKIKISHWKT